MDRNRAQDLLGAAVFTAWGELPRDVQELLFEAAVNGSSDGVREDLAKLLHEIHPRTAHRSDR